MRTIPSSALLCMLAVCGAKAQEGNLLVYTSQPQTDAQQTIDGFKAKYPKLAVSFIRDGTPRLMAKLNAEIEAGRPQPDILLIADSITMEGLKKQGRLLAYEAAETAGYPDGVHDRDKTWFGTKLITTGIVYNTKAPFVPASWTDLLKPEAKGLVTLPSPLASGAAMIHTVTLTGNLPQGWSFYEALHKNGAVPAGGNGDVLKQVAGGQKLFGMVVDYLPVREQAKGAPLRFVFPADGVSAVTEPVAILKTAKNPDGARRFVDFLLSTEGQQLAAKQGYIPALPSVALPAGYPDRAAIKVLPFDPARALADEAVDRKRFTDIFEQ